MILLYRSSQWNVEVGYPTFLNSVKNGLCDFKERKFTVWIVIFQFYPHLYLYIIFLLTLSELMMWYYPYLVCLTVSHLFKKDLVLRKNPSWQNFHFLVLIMKTIKQTPNEQMTFIEETWY